MTTTDDSTAPANRPDEPERTNETPAEAGSTPPRSPKAVGGRATRGRLDPDALAALVEERDFLLRSLDDLEREHDAGDVDDHDYETLKDDYTARAARSIRAIESHRARARAARRPRSWRRLVVTVAAVAAFAVLAGVLVAQASGRRGSNDALTGDIRQSTREQLAEAIELATGGDLEGAVAVYDDVLDDDPTNAEALTYRGWFQFLSGDTEGLDSLIDALEADPEYPDAHAFMAVILERAGRPVEALAALDRLEALDPPPGITAQVAGLRERLEAAVAAGGGGGTSPTTAPPAAP